MSLLNSNPQGEPLTIANLQKAMKELSEVYKDCPGRLRVSSELFRKFNDNISLRTWVSPSSPTTLVALPIVEDRHLAPDVWVEEYVGAWHVHMPSGSFWLAMPYVC